MYRKLFLVTLVVLWTLIQGSAAFGAGGSLIGRWMCDEGQGTVVSDSSGNKRNGTFVDGAPAWTTGHAGSAVKLVAPTLVEIPSINMTLSEATMAGWLLPDGAQSEWASIIMHRGSGTAHGFNMLADGRLAYHWNNDSATWGYRGNAYYSTTEWTHCAVTIQPTKATFYVNGVEASVNAINHSPANWNQPFHLGGDRTYTDGTRRMKGALDDVMMFSRALDAAQVAGLMNGTLPMFLKAEKPTPTDGAVGVMMGLFQWTPGETGVFDDVYLGTTPELTAADRKSHQSAMIKMYFQMVPPLVPGQKYYWRVDTIDATGKVVAVGNVWSFTTLALNASVPKPADGATGEFPGLTLTWLVGKEGTANHVYFGPDMAAVANGDADADKGQMAETTFNTPALRASTTYYWRVDTVKFDGSIVQGEVWSFATADAGPTDKIIHEWWFGIGGSVVSDLTGNANYPKNPTAMEYVNQFASAVDWADNYGQRFYGWLKPPETGDYTFWIAGDDEQQLWLSTDENPTNAVMIANVPGWTPANDFDNTGGGTGNADAQKSDPMPLKKGFKYFIMALGKEGGGGDSTSVAWQGGPIATREIIKAQYVDAFSLAPLVAFGPSPANGAVDTLQTLALTWNAGEKAAQHEVYFGDDAAAVGDADTSSPLFKGRQGGTSFGTGALEWGKTYYWRVDEINAGEAGSPWRGGVWSFTTADYIPVDDFESYTDEVEGRIFQTWIDGWGFTEPAPGNPGNGTGATVGYIDPPFAEHTIVHGGKTSMPLGYNNADSPFYSETERTFDSPQNWTANGMNTLSLQVRGYPEVNNVSVTETGGKMSLTGAGADIWGTSDEFTYAYKSLNGDGTIIAKVASNGTGSNVWAKGGVMIRDDLDGRSASAQMVITGDTSGGNGAAFQNRSTAGLDMNANDAASNTASTGVVAPPYWVKLERFGNSFSGYTSPDGNMWTIVGTQEVVMAGPVYIGLCVTSHVAGTPRTYQFESIKTTGSVTGAWQGAEIMSPLYNSPQDLYVAIQDSTNKIAVVKDATVVNSATWTEVQMPLSSFTGVSMTKVKKIFIGVGDRTNRVADGMGMLFIDDIRVIKPAP